MASTAFVIGVFALVSMATGITFATEGWKLLPKSTKTWLKGKTPFFDKPKYHVIEDTVSEVGSPPASPK